MGGEGLWRHLLTDISVETFATATDSWRGGPFSSDFRSSISQFSSKAKAELVPWSEPVSDNAVVRYALDFNFLQY